MVWSPLACPTRSSLIVLLLGELSFLFITIVNLIINEVARIHERLFLFFFPCSFSLTVVID